uniref:Uncharacterized protein n=1 Tax=Rhizophora mucronata TaxID=61149 RepID=A0A2P2NC17_RHIMU
MELGKLNVFPSPQSDMECLYSFLGTRIRNKFVWAPQSEKTSVGYLELCLF